MLFDEIIAVYTENYTKPIIKNRPLHVVARIYNYHKDLKS
jgi:hypothetical protein